MSYIRENIITSNEEVILEPKITGVFLFWRWVAGILFCWLLLIPTFIAIKETVNYKHTEYALTNKRVIEKYGWLNSSNDQMTLDRIENVTVHFTFWGKIFNYGTISFQGNNRNNVNFSNIKDAQKVAKAATEYIDNYKDSLRIQYQGSHLNAQKF